MNPVSRTFSRCGVLLVVGLLLASASLASSVVQLQSRDWLRHYFQRPDPDRFVSSMYELSQTDYFALPNNAMVGIGFVASLFRDNPDRIDEWLLLCRNLPEREARIMVAALWYAEYPKAQEVLKLWAQQVVRSPNLRADLERIADRPPAWERVPVNNRPALYLTWGRYLATGDPLLLHEIFAAIPQVETMSVRDRWWLACKLAEQDVAVEWCQSQLDRQPEDVRANLELVIHAAGSTAIAEEE